ncbi:MAG: GNAT family N-acetyltransferase [Moraxellaceae bacterium]|nr:GNAT family N-acetyltransferase [Moraxellaceae bacterium]
MNTRLLSITQVAAQVRPAIVTDARGMAEVHVAAAQAAYGDIMPADFIARFSVEQSAASWHERLRRSSGRSIYVVECDGRIAGFAACGPSRDPAPTVGPTGQLHVLNVAPAFWRQGLGRALCSQIIHEARQRGCRTLSVWVLADNAAARALYAANGFTPDGIERMDDTLCGRPLRELRYVRTLP